MSRASISTQPPTPVRLDMGVQGRPSRPPAGPESAPPTAPHRHPVVEGRVDRPSVLIGTRDRGSLFRLKRELHADAHVVSVRSVDQLLNALDAAGPRAMLVIDLSAPSVDLLELFEAIDTHFPDLPTLLWGEAVPGGPPWPSSVRRAEATRRLPTSADASEVARVLRDFL